MRQTFLFLPMICFISYHFVSFIYLPFLETVAQFDVLIKLAVDLIVCVYSLDILLKLFRIVWKSIKTDGSCLLVLESLSLSSPSLCAECTNGCRSWANYAIEIDPSAANCSSSWSRRPLIFTLLVDTKLYCRDCACVCACVDRVSKCEEVRRWGRTGINEVWDHFNQAQIGSRWAHDFSFSRNNCGTDIELFVRTSLQCESTH